ncbi:DUF1758 domain-containing protein [Trichonephila clavipes]|nr:DUF1758 domain-containing protein [Trichonephila clavipes]
MKVAQLTQRKSKFPLPLFLVEVRKNVPDSRDIRDISTCCYMSITWDSFRRRPGPSQCYNCNQLLPPQKVRETVVPTETEKRSFKLPKIELKKFSGEAKDFLVFWSQFQKVHNDKSIAEEDKMQYLLQSVEPKSKAERLVLSFPATAENYPKAIDQLKEIFGREDLLVQIYVRELLNLVIKNAVSGRTKTDLSTLYDELEGKLRSLESLGRTQEKYGDFLAPLVESCLPEEILMAWERKRNTETDAKGSRTLEHLRPYSPLT